MLLTLPPASWPDPLPPYLAFIRERAPVLLHPETGDPVPSWAGGRHLIDYAEADIDFLVDMVDAIFATFQRQPRQYGAFLDHAFRQIEDWMIPEHFYLFPAKKWALCRRNFDRLLFLLEMKGIPFLANGDRSIEGTLYLELAQRHWFRDTYIWSNMEAEPDGKTKLAHVLSVDAEDEDAVDRVVSLHNNDKTRWVAFTTFGSNEEAIDAAYARVAAGR